MAKIKAGTEDGKGGEGKAGKKKPRLHLHEIRSVHAEDGSIVHHHTYKEKPDSEHTMPERGPMATSGTPEEAGQHVAEMFGQNQGGAGTPNEEAEPAAGAGGAAPEPEAAPQAE